MWYSFSTPDEPLPCRYVVPPSTTSSFVPSVSRPRSERDARRGPANAQTAFVYPRHYQPFSLISPRNRLVPSRLVPFRPVLSRPNPSHFAALLVNRGSIVRSVLGNDESTSVKLASRFRPRFSECLLLPRSDEKSFSSDDPRWIHGGRTIDGPIDRQDGSVSVNEIGQPVLDYVSPFVDCTETTATLNGRHSARSTRGQIFFFSFLFFPPRSFRSDRNVYNEERSREGERERGRERERGGGGAPPSNSTRKRRRISRAVSKDDNLLRPTAKDRLTSRKRTKTALYMGSRWEGWVESLRFIRLLAATVL